MTPYERAVKTVNDWYDNEDAKREELIHAVASAIVGNNNQELEGYRKKRADLEDRLAQSDAHRKLLVSSYREIQERLANVATRKKELGREKQRLVAENYKQHLLLSEIFGIVAGGAYQGYNYTDAVARIKTMISEAKLAMWHDQDYPGFTDAHHNED